MVSAQPLPQILSVRVCLLGGDTVVSGVGKTDVASALLRGITADCPGVADPTYDFAFNFGIFQREWDRLFIEPADGKHSGDRWGLGPLGAWISRVRFDKQDAGKVSPPYDAHPMEDCASVCPGNPEKLNVGPPYTKNFREVLTASGQDVTALEGVHRKLYWEAEARPRELVRLDDALLPEFLLASFARFSPEVGEVPGCGAAILNVFKPGFRPLGNDRNLAMLYMPAPNGRVHRDLTAGSFLCALQAAGTNACRLLREYNLLASGRQVGASLNVGKLVRLRGLGAPGLNGQEGTCESWDIARGRWSVRLRSGGEAGQIKAVRPENLDEHPEWRKSDLRALLEFQLCDRNLRKDWKPGAIQVFGQKMFATNLEGWIELDRIRSCNKLFSASVCTRSELLDALKESKSIETKEDDEGLVYIRHVRSQHGGVQLPPQRIRPAPPVVAEDGVVEPRPKGPRVVSPPRRPVNEACKDLVTTGYCARGSKCNYIHDEIVLGKAMPAVLGVPPPVTLGRLFVGSPVQLQGLTKMPHLNGRRGKCESLDEVNRRWQVRLGDGAVVALKECNLALL